MKAIHPRAHWEIARGSTDENIKYCSKGGDFHELGERPKVGSCGKFVDAVAMVVAGDTIVEVATENPEAYARGGRGLRELQYVLSKPYEHTGVRGYWYCGPPGTGKSHKAREFRNSSSSSTRGLLLVELLTDFPHENDFFCYVKG